MAIDTPLDPSDVADTPAEDDVDVCFVNAYEVVRIYGGPEEGGWWYDAGTPLASVPCRTDAEVAEARRRLHAVYDAQYADRRTRYSVIGEEDLVVCVEDAVAAPFPAARPHYE